MLVKIVLSLEKNLKTNFAGQETRFIDMLISSSESPKTHPWCILNIKNFPGLYPRSLLKGDGRGKEGRVRGNLLQLGYSSGIVGPG